MSTSSTSSSDQEIESKNHKKSKLAVSAAVDKKGTTTKKMKPQIVIRSSESSSSSGGEEMMIKKKQSHPTTKKKVTFKDDVEDLDDNKKKKSQKKVVSDVKATPHVKATPKKSKKPTAQDMQVEKNKTKGSDKDDSSDSETTTTKKKSIPKKDQEITVPEMTRLLSRFVDSINETTISTMKETNPALFDQFVSLIEPYRAQWLYSTQAGRLFKFVADKKSEDGGRFVCITEDPRLMVLGNYTKKEEFPLEELYKRYMAKHLPDAEHEKTKEGKLFQFINGNTKMCSEVSVEDKMQQCILHSKDDKKSYWVNSPEGRDKLGLVINVRPRKMDEDSIAKEVAKLERTRKNICQLLDGENIDDEIMPQKKKKNKPATRKFLHVPTDDDDDDAFVETKKIKKKVDEKNMKIDVPEKKQQKKKTIEKDEKATKKKEKKDKSSDNDDDEYTKYKKPTKNTDKKRKADELESPKSSKSSSSSKSSTTQSTPNKKSKIGENTTSPKPTKTTTTPKPARTTVVTSVSIDDDMINKIKQMNSNQLRAMLDDEKKKVQAIDKETLERIEWFERYSPQAKQDNSMMVKAC